MSTRCQMGIYANETDLISKPADGVFIYRHSDGYPDGECGVVADILPFLRAFNEKRGIGDTSYCAARLVQHITNIHDQIYQAMTQEASKNGDPVTFFVKHGGVLGCGIDTVLHGDIQYFYHVSPTALKVYKVTYNSKTYSPQRSDKWVLVQTFGLKIEKEVA